MSALVERIIAARDRLRGFAVPSDDDIIEARNAMADAANAITERDETIHTRSPWNRKLSAVGGWCVVA